MSGLALIGTLHKNEKQAVEYRDRRNREAREDRYVILEIGDEGKPGMWMVISKQQLNGANL